MAFFKILIVHSQYSTSTAFFVVLLFIEFLLKIYPGRLYGWDFLCILAMPRPIKAGIKHTKMKSRITIEVDFEHGNQPVIQIVGRNSITEPDVRDSLVQTFLQNFQGNTWAKINFKLADRDSGELSFHARAIISAIKPEDLEIEWQKMKDQDDYNHGVVLKPREYDDIKKYSETELDEKITESILVFLSNAVEDKIISSSTSAKIISWFAKK